MPQSKSVVLSLALAITALLGPVGTVAPPAVAAAACTVWSDTVRVSTSPDVPALADEQFTLTPYATDLAALRCRLGPDLAFQWEALAQNGCTLHTPLTSESLTASCPNQQSLAWHSVGFGLTVSSGGQPVAKGLGGTTITVPGLTTSAWHGPKVRVEGHLLERVAATSGLAGAAVQLELRARGDRNWRALATVRTDAEGRFAWSKKIKHALAIRAVYAGDSRLPRLVSQPSRMLLIHTTMNVVRATRHHLVVRLRDTWGKPLRGELVKVAGKYDTSGKVISKDRTDSRGVARLAVRPGVMVAWADVDREHHGGRVEVTIR